MNDKLHRLFCSIVAFGLLFAPNAWTAPADEHYIPPPLTQQLSSDGNSLYYAAPPMVYVVDPNPSAERMRIPARFDLQSPPESATATFSITYIPSGGTDLWGASCTTFPEEAKTAFNAAAAIWGNILGSSVPITINACWSNLGDPTLLGYSGGAPLSKNFAGAPRANTWYTGSLANALAGSDLDPTEFDMHLTYNSAVSWYYGTDANTPSTQMDLMSVVLHEITHGLNFSGSMTYSGGTGSWGYGSSPAYPIIYDTFMRDGSGNQLIDPGVYANPSNTLGSALTSDNIWFHGSNAMAANGGQRVKMYAPSAWLSGSSYSHMDYNTFRGTANALMVYALSKGTARHDPGPIVEGILKDLGWPTGAASCTVTISPTSSNFSAGANTGTVDVTSSSSSCAWSATSNASWITITAGSAGNGNGTVSYSVSTNTTGSTRTGTMTIGGQTFTITQNGSLDLGSALDNTSLVWTTGGNVPFTTQTTTYYYGGSSGQTGSIGNNQSTYLSTSVTGPGTLSFYWKVSSEQNNDIFSVYLDGVRKYSLSGNVDWSEFELTILAGTHTVKWEYVKNSSLSSGQDAGWVDYVVFTPICQQCMRDLITYFYNTVLNRAPEAGAVDAWENGYFNYALNFNIDVKFIPVEMGRGFFLSAEYQSRSRTNAEFITDCYRAFLHRDPYSWELADWLSGVWNRSEVMAMFANSAEFADYVANLFPGFNGLSTRNFVTTMYIGLLDRLVDIGGLLYWSDLFDNATDKRALAKWMAEQVANAPEFQDKVKTNEDLIIRLYRSFLGRFPSDGEIAYWTGELTAGRQTLTTVIDLFASSNEFTQIMIKYFPSVVLSYSISLTSQSFTASGGTGSLGVTTTSGCSWTASSNASWMSITAGSSGSGNGTVSYSVSANMDTSTRSGTMTIAGKTFTVNQSGASDSSGKFQIRISNHFHMD